MSSFQNRLCVWASREATHRPKTDDDQLVLQGDREADVRSDRDYDDLQRRRTTLRRIAEWSNTTTTTTTTVVVSNVEAQNCATTLLLTLVFKKRIFDTLQREIVAETEWADVLPLLDFQYSSSFHTTTNIEPYRALFGSLPFEFDSSMTLTLEYHLGRREKHAELFDCLQDIHSVAGYLLHARVDSTRACTCQAGRASRDG